MKYQNVKTGFILESDSICAGGDWVVLEPPPVTTEEKEPREKVTERKTQPRSGTKRTKK